MPPKRSLYETETYELKLVSCDQFLVLRANACQFKRDMYRRTRKSTAHHAQHACANEGLSRSRAGYFVARLIDIITFICYD
jgi:hypothetical protein